MMELAPCLLALGMLASLAACGADSSGGEKKPITPDKEGVAVGHAGDTLRTARFDMTIENPRTNGTYDTLTANEGCQFFAADVTLYNHTGQVQPVLDTDFEVVWDVEDVDAWAWPECDVTGAGGEETYSVRSDTQLPLEFELASHETRTGVLLYQVPADREEFIIAYYEAGDTTLGVEPGFGDAFYVLLRP